MVKNLMWEQPERMGLKGPIERVHGLGGRLRFPGCGAASGCAVRMVGGAAFGWRRENREQGERTKQNKPKQDSVSKVLQKEAGHGSHWGYVREPS
jgi:hypothetical protein